MAGDHPLSAGMHQVRMEFAYDGEGLGGGGDVALFVDGDKGGAGRLSATVPLIFSADETCHLGADRSSPVSDVYTPESSSFTGSMAWIQLDIGPDVHDHLITAADQWRIATARHPGALTLPCGHCGVAPEPTVLDASGTRSSAGPCARSAVAPDVAMP
jgi:hypothetical protein